MLKKYLLTTFTYFVPLFISAQNSWADPTSMVVSENKIASQIGADILKNGGNAIDAAVAVGYALAVVNPCCGNIGGGGFMVIHLANDKDIFLNFRETAPANARKNMFLDKQGNIIPDKSTQGYLAVAVPGTVLGLDTALKRYGTMSRKQVMAPAIRLAQEGYILTPYEVNLMDQYTDDFRKNANVAAIFLNNDKPYLAGERFIQTNLANTLKHIAEKGPDYFYRGPIADTIVKASNAQGGILSRKDFANYHVTESAPIYCTYRGYTLISAAPPSSGGVTLCEILNILENFSLDKFSYHSPQEMSVVIDAMGYGFRDRNLRLGDPAFVKNPLSQLLSKEYAEQISKQIAASAFEKNTKLENPQHELTDTTHYSIVDNKGNAVSVTYTLNGFFGARVIAGNTGFFLNDEMDDFAIKPGSTNKFNLVQHEANAIQPGKRPLSSMTPTIIMKDGKLFMVIGSPGGPRIITAVLLSILNVLDGGMTLQQAVDRPRFHFQAEPDVVEMEPLALPFLTLKALRYRGYTLLPQKNWAAVEAILIDPDTGKITGANDVRRPDGGAIGS